MAQQFIHCDSIIVFPINKSMELAKIANEWRKNQKENVCLNYITRTITEKMFINTPGTAINYPSAFSAGSGRYCSSYHPFIKAPASVKKMENELGTWKYSWYCSNKYVRWNAHGINAIEIVANDNNKKGGRIIFFSQCVLAKTEFVLFAEHENNPVHKVMTPN